MMAWLVAAAVAGEPWLDATQPLPVGVGFLAETLAGPSTGPSDSAAFGSTRSGLFLFEGELRFRSVVAPPGPTKRPGQVVDLRLPRAALTGFEAVDERCVALVGPSLRVQVCLDAWSRHREAAEGTLRDWFASSR